MSKGKVTSTAREALWKKVFSRRLKHLEVLEINDFMEIKKVITKPRDCKSEEEWREYLKYLLENYFLSANDENLDPEERENFINSLKKLFEVIDIHVGKQKAAAELEEKDQRAIRAAREKASEVSSKEMRENVAQDAASSRTKPMPDNNYVINNPIHKSSEGDAAVENTSTKGVSTAVSMSASSNALSSIAVQKATSSTDIPSSAAAGLIIPGAKPKEKKSIPPETEILTISDDDEEEGKSTPQLTLQLFTLLADLNFKSDIHNTTTHSGYSSSIKQRTTATKLAIDKIASTMSPTTSTTFLKRLSKWDPFWISKEHIAIAQTTPPLKKKDSFNNALAFSFIIPAIYVNDHKINWGTKIQLGKTATGAKALLLRMLPKTANYKYPDTHSWPKGTFLQINHQPIALSQRKQQSHDDKLWKGMCQILDVTSYINPRTKTMIELASYDDTPFCLHLGITEYIAPVDLMKTVTTRVSYNMSLEQAKNYVNKQTVKIDEDDNAPKENKIPLTFSLSCPITMVKINLPARGRFCNHIQCFDLLTFIQSNSFPSGRRWRCPFCEQFTAVEDMVICEMFVYLLEKFDKEIEPGSKDKVEYVEADKTWILQDPKKNKRGCVSEEQEHEIKKRKKVVEEIILV